VTCRGDHRPIGDGERRAIHERESKWTGGGGGGGGWSWFDRVRTTKRSASSMLFLPSFIIFTHIYNMNIGLTVRQASACL